MIGWFFTHKRLQAKMCLKDCTIIRPKNTQWIIFVASTRFCSANRQDRLLAVILHKLTVTIWEPRGIEKCKYWAIGLALVELQRVIMERVVLWAVLSPRTELTFRRANTLHNRSIKPIKRITITMEFVKLIRKMKSHKEVMKLIEERGMLRPLHYPPIKMLTITMWWTSSKEKVFRCQKLIRKRCNRQRW